mgnify:FL=1
MAAEFNISHDKGTSFKFYALYKDSAGSAVNLSGYSARMQIRRSPDDPKMTLFVTGSGVTNGGTTGEFSGTGGVSGTGGITLNASSSGAAGTNGGVYIEFNAVSSANLPTGRMFYDLELVNGEDITRLVEGRFEARANITR